MTTPTNLSDEALAAELARRQDEARARQAEETATRQAERVRRAEVVRAGFAAEEERLKAAEQDAHAAFRAAVLADPMVAAWVRYRWHRFRRDRLRDESNTAARILGRTELKESLRWVDPRLLEEVLSIADDEARASAFEESDVVFDALQNP